MKYGKVLTEDWAKVGFISMLLFVELNGVSGLMRW
jgi:hypothetical protein